MSKMITLDHVTKTARKNSEPYISYDFNRDVKFIDCQIATGARLGHFLWSIGFDCDTKVVKFYDAKMQTVKLEEFIEIVTAHTPQYLTALLFLLPDPAGYFEELNV